MARLSMKVNAPGSLALSDLLSPQSIHLALEGRECDETLAELIGRIPGIADRPEARQMLLRALQEREQLHTTNLGDGVAMPHARNALVGLVDQPTVVFGRHDKGVPYGPADRHPAHLFFLFVAPSVTQHLALASRAARLLRAPRLRQSLLDAGTPESVIGLIRDAEAAL